MTLVLLLEKLHQHRGECLRGDVVGLTCKRAALRVGQDVCNSIGGVAEPWSLTAVDDKRGNLDGGRLLCRQRVVTPDSSIVEERVGQSLLGGAKRLCSHVGDEFGGEAHFLREEELDHVASPSLLQHLGELFPVPLRKWKIRWLPQRQFLDFRGQSADCRRQGQDRTHGSAIDGCLTTRLLEEGCEIFHLALDCIGGRISTL